jgi:hypothetical protein
VKLMCGQQCFEFKGEVIFSESGINNAFLMYF